MANPDKYRNFGFRQVFYAHFVECGIDCFNMSVLGKDQYKSLRQWLGDAGVLKKNGKKRKRNCCVGINSFGAETNSLGSI